jgi:DNA-binding transcriptional MerR regulator
MIRPATGRVNTLELAPGQGSTVNGMEQEPPERLLTVGVMARRSGLTAKALRHYHRVGLLRSLALPLDQVRTAVQAWRDGDSAATDQVIRRHRRLLDACVSRLAAGSPGLSR